MAVTYKSTSSGNVPTAGPTTFTVPIPAGAANGDMLVAFQLGGNTNLTPMSNPTGGTPWATVRNIASTQNLCAKLWYKIAGASEPANYVFNCDGTATAGAIIVAFSGAAPPPLSPVKSAMTNTFTTPRVDIPALNFENSTGVALSFGAVCATAPLASGSFFIPSGYVSRGILLVGDNLRYEIGITKDIPTPTGNVVGFPLEFTRAINAGIGATFAVETAAAQSIGPAGNIASAEAFGSPSIVLATPQSITVQSIPTAEAFGTARLIQEQFVRPSGITSGEAFGTDNVVKNIIFLPVPGIPSEEAFGVPSLTLLDEPVFISPSVQETPAARNILHIRFGIDRGISLLKNKAGEWYLTRYPAQTEIEDSLVWFMGGAITVLTPELVAELTAAGFGEYIHLRRKDTHQGVFG